MRSKSAFLLLGAALPPKMAFFGHTACRFLAGESGHNRPMSLHIGAQKGEISEKILLPGDPLRAKWVAENYLDGAKQYNSIRNMFGYTGTYRGERISVQGTGMGLPSLSIYVTELFNEHGVESAIRIGTCGAIQEKTKVGDLILAMTASTDSNINRRFTNG